MLSFTMPKWLTIVLTLALGISGLVLVAYPELADFRPYGLAVAIVGYLLGVNGRRLSAPPEPDLPPAP